MPAGLGLVLLGALGGAALPAWACTCSSDLDVNELLRLVEAPDAPDAAGDTGEVVSGTLVAISPGWVRVEIEGEGALYFERIAGQP